MRKCSFLILLALSVSVSGANESVDLSRHFAGLEGTFVLVDHAEGVTRVYDQQRAETAFLPASTFKIPNSIIALETGVVNGSDSDLENAFRRSLVPYYQELARRIGEERMSAWVDRLDYGNENPGPVIDTFWLQGDLRISAVQQVDFLQRLYFDQLGLSESTTQTMKSIMVLEEGEGFRISGKTGTALRGEGDQLGWLVGWVERGERVWFFALNIGSPDVFREWPGSRRLELVKTLLRELNVLPR